MNRVKRLLIVRIILLLLGWVVVSAFPLVGVSQENNSTPILSAEDLDVLRARIFSRSIDYSKRVQTASSLTRLLEIKNLPRSARRLCLDFYDSTASILEDSQSSEEIGSPYLDYALAIEQGKRRDTVEAMDAFIKSATDVSPHPCLSILALKADNMPLTYRILYADFANQKLTPYSLYVLGILAAREKRLIEGERFMARARGGLGSPILERWLSIDLAKLSIVNNKAQDAPKIIQDLLAKNPQDAQALNILIFSNLETKKELARQQLSQLIDLLYPDPYLIAETAKLAIQLMELDTAAKILEQYESKVEPNRDFYEVFAFVRKNQNRQQEADQWMEKARQVHDSRVAVASVEPLSDELREAVASQDERIKEIESLEGVDTLSKVYYCLLDEDFENAIAILQSEQSNPYESFILASIQSRIGRFTHAMETLSQIKIHFPQFRPYSVLSLLADLCARLGDRQQASFFYKELLERYPESYQADIAKAVLENPTQALQTQFVQPIQVSSRMSRYVNYAAPFIFTEIQEHWGDAVNTATFATFANRLRVSPRRGILFHEFVRIFASVTRHQVIPFVGTGESIMNCLRQDIPVVYCQGEMFGKQEITELLLIVGADPSRGQFYAEGISPNDSHLLTEKEILEGICFAVYPPSLEPQWNPETMASIEQGKEFIKLHLEASHIQVDPDYDATNFTQRQRTILEETSPSFLPHKLAFLRWTLDHKPGSVSGQYLESIKNSCADSAHFLFLSAVYHSNQKNPSEANTALDMALKRQPELPRFVLAQVRFLDQTLQTAEAIKQAELLREQFPEDSLISSQILLLYRKAGQTNKEKEEEARLKKLLNVDSIKIEDFEEDESSSPLSP